MQKLCCVLTVFLAFTFVCSAQNITQNCDNVLFRNRTDDFWESFLYTDTPQPYSGNSIACRFHFQPGDDQCCTQLWYDALAVGWIRVRARAALAVTAARIAREKWVQARERFRPVRRDVDQALTDGKITQQQHDALITFINNVLAAWDSFIDRLINDWARCMSMWLKYVAGILCLGCDPEWERYIYEANGRIHLRLTEETCNDIRSGCLPVWQLVFELIQNLQDAVNQLLIDLGETPVDYTGQTICNGDCGAWLCAVFFGGRDSQLDSALPAPDATKKRNADHAKNVFNHLESKVTKIFVAHKGGAEFSAAFSDLLWTTHTAIRAMEQVHRQDDTLPVQNDYVAGTPDNAYGPVAVGSKSGLDTNVAGDSGSSATLSSWISFLF